MVLSRKNFVIFNRNRLLVRMVYLSPLIFLYLLQIIQN